MRNWKCLFTSVITVIALAGVAGVPAHAVASSGANGPVTEGISSISRNVGAVRAPEAQVTAKSAARLAYVAQLVVGKGLSVGFTTRASKVLVRYRMPVTDRHGQRTRLRPRSIQVKAVHGHARIVLPLDAVQPRARAVGARGAWTPITVTPAAGAPAVATISAGDFHACALLGDGTVRCWGGNHMGQLADGTRKTRPVPEEIDGLSGVTAISVGWAHACAMLGDGTVRCWGDNGAGQLGDGTTSQRSGSVAVTGLSGVVSLAAGGSHTCALHADGSAHCWGENGDGQLGAGAGLSGLTPVPVVGLSGARKIVAFSDHTCALLENGQVQCWGANDAGQLGDGTTKGSDRPVAVAGLGGVTDLTGEWQRTCALVADGTVSCWGSNDSNRLGAGAVETLTTPTPVPGVTGAVVLRGTCALIADGTVQCAKTDGDPVAGWPRISGVAGATTITDRCALHTDGTVRCWGGNGWGEVGDGTNISRPRGAAVVGLSGVRVLVPAGGATLAILADGSVRAWGGDNFNGILGDGTTLPRYAPVLVSALGATWTPTPAPEMAPGSGAAGPRATVAGSYMLDARGRVVATVSSNAATVTLSYLTKRERRRTATVTIASGSGVSMLPAGAHTIRAQATSSAALRASTAVWLAPRADPAGGTALVPNGLVLPGSPNVDRALVRGVEVVGEPSPAEVPGMAVDGTGAVWVKGMWQVTRLDPATGTAQTWDAADDAVFARVELIAPAAGAGAWLVVGDRLRLFDGQEFARDLTIPAKVFAAGAGPGAIGHVHDVLDAGSELWVGLHDVGWDEAWTAKHHSAVRIPARRVARWSSGHWKVMSTAPQNLTGDLALDTTGRLWAGGWVYFEGVVSKDSSGWTSEGARIGLRQWNGKRWVLPGAARLVKGQEGALAADPTGGVWLLTSNLLGKAELLRYRAGKWHRVASDLSAALGDGWIDASMTSGSGRLYEQAVTGWFTVDDTGRAWLAGSKGVVRVDRDGTMTTFGPRQGVPGTAVAGPVVVGDQVLLLDGAGVMALQNGRFTRLWSDLAVVPAPLSEVVAVSNDEVWALGDDAGGSARWFHRVNGAWHQVGEPTTRSCRAVLASDGAVWTTTSQGLVRMVGDAAQVVAVDVRQCPAVAGADGSVVLETSNDQQQGPGGYATVRPDGSRTLIPYPDGPDLPCRLAGRAGTLLIDMVHSDCMDEGYSIGPAVWDGARWNRLPAPVGGPEATHPYVMDLAITDDGALWAQLWLELPYDRYNRGDPKHWLARYTQGAWQLMGPARADTSLLGLEAAPGGRVCTRLTATSGTSAVACYGAAGEVARFDTTGMAVTALGVGLDGAVWVTGPQLARLGVLG
jgi:alpha-tubulin suppressor-like RCC1 family protein